LARRFLRSHGYKILYRNFRACGGGEIDIVCRGGDTLVFVEVKTRSDEDFGRPIEAVADKSSCAFPKEVLPGCVCWTIPISFFVSTSWKFYCPMTAFRISS
jgi:putative endonuclease